MENLSRTARLIGYKIGFPNKFCDTRAFWFEVRASSSYVSPPKWGLPA